MLRLIVITIGSLLATGLVHADEAGRIVFVAGDAKLAGQPITRGQPIHEGDEIGTGADGYIHLKTIDNGILILRPSSRARIATYHIDTQNPANTRIKLELLDGVARSISGEAVKQARQNFRFNTPVAAIGVRGTDFTAFTDQSTTRIAVASGGVVVSGFSGACSPQGVGPCEGGTSRELFSEQIGKLLQVRSSQPMPQLLPSNGITPDLTVPPGGNEPAHKATSPTSSGTAHPATDLSLDAQKGTSLLNATPITPTPTAIPTPTPAPAPQYQQIVWGRWQPLLDQAATVGIATIAGPDGRVLAINSHYVLARSSGVEWSPPSQGSMDFALKQSEAFIINPAAGTQAPAKLENGRLQVNFAKSTFTTGFDLVSTQGERFNLKAQGDVSSNGQLLGASQFSGTSNMAVKGAVGPDAGGSAAYIFQGNIGNNRQAVGGTSWIKR